MLARASASSNERGERRGFEMKRTMHGLALASLVGAAACAGGNTTGDEPAAPGEEQGAVVGDGDVGPAAAPTWQVIQTGMLLADVECDAAGTCLLLESPNFEQARVVNLDTGVEQIWPITSNMRPVFFDLVAENGHFWAAGGSYYFAALLDVDPAGLSLAWSNECDGGCEITGMFTSMAVAGGVPHAMLVDGRMLRGGASWEVVDSPVEDAVWNVAGSPSGALHGVGLKGIYAFDGTAWQLEHAAEGFWRIWSDDSGFVAAAGVDGQLLTGSSAGWTVTHVGTSTFSGIWGSSASDVWAVGGAGNIFHWDGATWTQELLPAQAVGADFVAVTGSGPGELIVATWDGLVLRRTP